MTAQVYRAYDAAGRLLYIGSSVCVETRLRAHERNHSYWWPFHARITRETFATEAEARAAERLAIATEHPRWNVRHRSPDHPDGRMTCRRSAPWLRDEIAEALRSA